MRAFRPDGGDDNGDDNGDDSDEWDWNTAGGGRQYRFGDDDEEDQDDTGRELSPGEKAIRDAIEEADAQAESGPDRERREWDGVQQKRDADLDYYAIHFMAGVTVRNTNVLLNRYQSAQRLARLAAKYPENLREMQGIGRRTVQRIAELHPLDMAQVQSHKDEATSSSSSSSRRPSRGERMQDDPNQPDLERATENYVGPPDEPPIPERINGWRYEESEQSGSFMWLAPASENAHGRAQDGVQVVHGGSTWHVRTFTRRPEQQATLTGVNWRYGSYTSLRFSPSEGAAGMEAAFERARSYMEQRDPPGEWSTTGRGASSSSSKTSTESYEFGTDRQFRYVHDWPELIGRDWSFEKRRLVSAGVTGEGAESILHRYPTLEHAYLFGREKDPSRYGSTHTPLERLSGVGEGVGHRLTKYVQEQPWNASVEDHTLNTTWENPNGDDALRVEYRVDEQKWRLLYLDPDGERHKMWGDFGRRLIWEHVEDAFDRIEKGRHPYPDYSYNQRQTERERRRQMCEEAAGPGWECLHTSETGMAWRRDSDDSLLLLRPDDQSDPSRWSLSFKNRPVGGSSEDFEAVVDTAAEWMADHPGTTNTNGGRGGGGGF